MIDLLISYIFIYETTNIYLYIKQDGEMVMKNTKLTSVKILEGLYNSFKLATVNTKMTLQKLTNRSIDMYLNDEEFRYKIETNQNLIDSGSNF